MEIARSFQSLVAIDNILVFLWTLDDVSACPAQDLAGLGTNAKGVGCAVHIIDAEVISLRLEDGRCVGSLGGRRGWRLNELRVGFGSRWRLFSSGESCLVEIKVVEKVIGFVGARGDLDEPHTDPAGLVCSPYIFFRPAKSGYGCGAADGAGDLAFFAVEPVAVGGEGGEGGSAPQFAIEVEGVVAAKDTGEGPAGIAQGPK